MKIKEAFYEVTAVKPSQYPIGDLPEFAFVGRSNVGKSSLINFLTGRKNLARVSTKPGKTREMNFYNIDNIIRFVDLPGYGYAGVSKAKMSSWGPMAEEYFKTRKQFKAVIFLVDIRHKPSKDDLQMHQWLTLNDIPFIVVATKSDKVSRSDLNNKLNDIGTAFELPENNKAIPISCVDKKGSDLFWEKVEKI